MKAYIVVVSSESGMITKSKDFDTQTEADSHVAKYGGFAVETPPGQPKHWTVSGSTLTHDAAAEAAAEDASSWEAIRERRDIKLKNSDFTQLDDSLKDKAQWKKYRQDLRDITTQLDPSNIIWPAEPINRG